MREEIAGGWRRLHNEELHSLNTSPNNITATMKRRMKWVWHAACMGDEKCIQYFGQKT
jgi:hypothetical protein